MNSRDNFLRYLTVAAAVLATFVVFGASGAQAASTHAVAASGSLVAEEHDEGDEEPSDESTDDSEDEDSDDEDSDDEDNETEEPNEEPTFTDPTFNDPTDDVTEMPTPGVENTSEASASPLGWILLAGGVLCAAAAVFIYRRNRHIM